MTAFAQRCCGKDTKRRTGSLKVYRFLTKGLMERVLSLIHPPATLASEGAKRRQNTFINMATAPFRNRAPPRCGSDHRTKSQNRMAFQQTRFVVILTKHPAWWT